MILFLPFLVFLFTIYYTVGNSISGSINQQKAVRGYFYALVRNNSYVNSGTDIKEFVTRNGMKRIGFNAIGWREDSKGGGDNQQAIAPCFKFSSVLKGDSSETCEGKERGESDMGPVSSYIRLFTFYGVCGPVYTVSTTGGAPEIGPSNQNSPANCSLSRNN